MGVYQITSRGYCQLGLGILCMIINHLAKIRLRESASARKPTLQIHVTTAKYFVLSFWGPKVRLLCFSIPLVWSQRKIFVFRYSSAMKLGGQSPFICRNSKSKKEDPITAPSSVLPTWLMLHQTDEIPEAIYVDGEKQRKWLCDCLLQATLVSANL